MNQNTLYYGDNLDILREYIQDESIDLIYLDPPFNSKRNYNVLFKDESGVDSEAQITAFDDTWHWNDVTEATYNEIATQVIASNEVATMIIALRGLLHNNQTMAYLVMMTARLIELHRALKPTGSIYLHCDPTASHYLKIVLDTIFGPENFQNEIIWRRSQTRSSISKIYRRSHDVILFYSKSKNYLFNSQHKDLSEASMSLYSNTDEQGAYQAVPLLVSGRRNGATGQTWRGINPNNHGKEGMHWVTIPEKLEEYDKKGLILWPKKDGGVPRLKYYLKDSPGVPMTDIWDDIQLISSSSAEALGYPTQKPLALLERIIQASSNAGDTVLDPFCGCGTAIAAAQKLGRTWVGIDITYLSISLQKYRLKDAFKIEPGKEYQVLGEPVDLHSARQLALDDRYQFQWWALSLIQAKPLGGDSNSKKGKKGTDKGIDGVINFADGAKNEIRRIIVQVKSGNVKSGDIRDLVGTVEREKAAMGVFITLDNPSKAMVTEAVTAGYYHSPITNRDYPKIQILSIQNLLHEAKVDMPASSNTFKAALRIKPQTGSQAALFEVDDI